MQPYRYRQQPAHQIALAKRKSVKADVLISIIVKNTGTVAEDAVIFDANGTYAKQKGYTQPGTITIESPNKNYDFIINKLMNSKYVVRQINVETNINVLEQLAYPLNFWIDGKTTNAKSILLDVHRNSNQRQLNMQEIPHLNIIVDAETALQTVVLPNNTYILRMRLTEVAN